MKKIKLEQITEEVRDADEVFLQALKDLRNRIDPKKLAEIEDEDWRIFADEMSDIIYTGEYLDCSYSERDQIKEIVSDRKIRAGRVKKDLEKELNFVNWEQERITNELKEANEEWNSLEKIFSDIKDEEDEEKYQEKYLEKYGHYDDEEYTAYPLGGY